MCDEALDDHELQGSVGIEGHLITNLRFANGIVLNAEDKEEADALVDSLDTTTTRYKMEIDADTTNVMANNQYVFQR